MPRSETKPKAHSAISIVLLALVIFSSGCQSSRVRWNLFNWQNLDRVPPPATGSLSIPGVSTSGFPTSNLPAPPASLPNGSNLPYVNSGTGQVNPGVYFNNGASQSGQWQGAGSASTGNQVSSNGTLSAIPGRDSSGWTPNNQPSVGAVVTNPLNGSNVTAVPPFLNAENFDPFSTDRIPSWNPSILEQAQASSNPLTVTSPNAAASSNTQLGWWPQNNGYNAQASYAGPDGNATLGNGQLLRSMQQSVKNVFNQQPANLGGFQTTAPIDNPMILATGFQGNGNAYATGNLGQGNPVQGNPAQAGVVPTVANPAAAQVNPQLNQQAAAQQWAEYQQRQLDQLRALQMQQLQAQAAVNPAVGVGTGPMQVLAVNTTSEIAESQSRMGIRTAAAQNLDPRYSGQVPQGSAAVAPGVSFR